MDEKMWGCSSQPRFAGPSQAPAGVGKAWAGLETRRELTYETAAQPRLGDGAIVRVAAQVELLIQVQALELALGSGKVRNGGQAGRRGAGAGSPGTGWGSPGRCR